MREPGNNLDSALLAIANELVPQPEEVAEARRRAKQLVRELHERADSGIFHVVRDVAHGSHARDTAIAGFKDIDCLVVLDEGALRTRDGDARSARDTVQRMASCIRRIRGGLQALGILEVRPQEHSVGVKYPAFGLRVDLVPAKETSEHGCFLIPDRTSDDWIETRPHRLKRHLTLAEQDNQHIRAAIRLLKGWRRARGKAMRIPSYAVELLAIHHARSHPTLEGVLRAFFQPVATADARRRLVLLGDVDDVPITVRDPWSGVNVCEELDRDHRAKLVENADKALDVLDEASALKAEGRSVLGVLRRLFVGNWQ